MKLEKDTVMRRIYLMEAEGIIFKCSVEIGKDIHIVGFDDLEIASMLVPPLTTVRQALEEKGYQAAHILRQCMLGDLRVPIQITLPVELIERASA